jgi:hypothetical protein
VAGLFRFLAAGVELLHGVLMLAWGLGLPLLVWQRFPRLRRAYIWFSLTFVGVSVVSHALLGECVLTTWARALWEAGGGYAERVPFVVTFTNRVAHIRPSTDAAVLVWEVAILAYCVLGLWGWRWMPRLAAARLPSRHPEGWNARGERVLTSGDAPRANGPRWALSGLRAPRGAGPIAPAGPSRR